MIPWQLHELAIAPNQRDEVLQTGKLTLLVARRPTP